MKKEKSANTGKQTRPLRFSTADTLQMEVKTRDGHPPRATSFSAVRLSEWALLTVGVGSSLHLLPRSSPAVQRFLESLSSPPHLHEFTLDFNSVFYQIGLFCVKQLHEAARPQNSGSMSQNKLKSIPWTKQDWLWSLSLPFRSYVKANIFNKLCEET